MLTPAVLTAALLAVAADPEFVLETRPVQRIEAVLSSEVRHPQVLAREWVVYVPRAPELPCQKQVKSTLEPGGRPYVESSPLRRQLLLARVPVRGNQNLSALAIKARHEATLYSRRLVPRDPAATYPPVKPLTPDERKLALAHNRMYDWQTSEFRNWLMANDLKRHDDETDLAFARRAFLTLQKKSTYFYKPDLDRRASAVCTDCKSDCGGLSVLFVSTMRANQIPARSLVGRWAQSDKPGEQVGMAAYHQQHSKAEFYAEKIGWVPVDPAHGLNSRGDEGLQYFGNDRGDFLVLHIDADLGIDTFHFGKQNLEWLQGVAYWVVGQGKSDRTKDTEEWIVRQLPQ